MSFLDSLVEEYIIARKINRVIYSDLVVNFQCTEVTNELKNEVDNLAFLKVNNWLEEKYHDEYFRKWDLVLKNPHYFLYKNPKEICYL